MVNVKGRYKAHGSEQQEFCIFKKQKKQKGEPGMRTAIFPENGRRMMSEGIAGKEDSPDCRYHFSSWRKRQPGETGTDCRTVFFRKDHFQQAAFNPVDDKWVETFSYLSR